MVILDIPVSISMEVGNTGITIRNLLQLNQGSVIELDRLAGEPLDVLVNGTKDIASLEEYNKDLKIINEYLEDYFNSCNEFFEELFPSTMRIFLNKFSDKLTIYTFNTPSLDDKIKVFKYPY